MMRKGDEMRALHARGLVLNCDFARGGARPRCGGARGAGRFRRERPPRVGTRRRRRARAPEWTRFGSGF